jgi:hypothetical protein
MAKSGSRFLPPSGALDATLVDWGSGRTMHRVHDAIYAANLFNPSPAGNARFSPIRDETGAVSVAAKLARSPEEALDLILRLLAPLASLKKCWCS